MSMIAKSISFDLPVPWTEGKFETKTIGRVNFLVGPNGSGKSMFAEALKSHLGNARILGTDRLSGMEHTSPYKAVLGTISLMVWSRISSAISRRLETKASA